MIIDALRHTVRRTWGRVFANKHTFALPMLKDESESSQSQLNLHFLKKIAAAGPVSVLLVPEIFQILY